MMFRSLAGLAALLMTTSLAQAAFDANSVAMQLQSEGYTRIEIKIGQSIAKVEAIKGTTKIEVTYDIASGTVLKTETEQVGADDKITPGVEIRTGRDDHDDDANDDGGSGSNSGRGGGDDDNEDDDHGGRHGGHDDDANDDR